MKSALRLAIALCAGVLHALSFAPGSLPWLQILALAVLFALALHAESWRATALLGFAFGLGWFGVGVSWVYISLHVYGLMPALVAGAATLAFCAFLALYPALALATAQAVAAPPLLRASLALPAAWSLTEWLRGTLLTGFPWLASGYAHTDGPLAGFAPLVGVYGITLIAALLAGVLAALTLPLAVRGVRFHLWATAVLAIALAGGHLLREQRWTQTFGPPISVKLVQANIPQDQKFTAEGLVRAFDGHWALMQGPRVDLVALPESVFPVPLELVPRAALAAFAAYSEERNSALIFGVFIEEPGDAFFNSAVGRAPDRAKWQRYSKQQLVPFGEFIPWGFRWFVDMMQMPIGDQQRGQPDQVPMQLAGQRIAVNICYEDLFGDVIRRAWDTPGHEPTMMLNLSNLAWFDDSLALPQHLQISRMRTLETQHPMLRATNTGATAVVDHRGVVVARLPYQTAAALDTQVQGMQGVTPFLRYGNGPAVVAAVLLLALGAAMARWGSVRSVLK